MKFDFAIGNPPYQTSIDTYNRQEPIYTHFYDATEKIAEKSLLITPARFLFNGGLTSKEWNKKMLSDEHLKVEYYNEKASEVFPNTEIKGGIAVVYRDSSRNFGAIGEFIPNDNLRKIAKHFCNDKKTNLPSIMFGGRSDLKFNELFVEENPESVEARIEAIQRKHPEVTELAPNEEFELKSSTLETLSFLFHSYRPNDNSEYYKILGLEKGKRTYKWIEKRYMVPRYPNRNNIDKYKVLFPEATGNGILGETLSTPIILGPMESATPTFISIGQFDTREEAEAALKYIKTKLVRTLLGILKKTQHTAPSNWAYVPVQDFSSKSDIDWNMSVSEIDKQLYEKYKLTQGEIDFIEKNVKEMD